jgi:hypothetical protein
MGRGIIKGTDELIQDMCLLLLQNVNSNFLAGHSSYKIKRTLEEHYKIIKRIFLSIAQLIAEKQQ